MIFRRPAHAAQPARAHDSAVQTPSSVPSTSPDNHSTMPLSSAGKMAEEKDKDADPDLHDRDRLIVDKLYRINNEDARVLSALYSGMASLPHATKMYESQQNAYICKS